MRRAAMPFLIAAVILAAPLGAAEGKFPVWMPTVITQPGHYIVTRDISAAAGPVISIQADGVTLDLNGFTVGTTDATRPVILIGGPPGGEEGIIVIDGKIQGGMHGIDFQPPDPVMPLALANLVVTDSAGAAVKGVGFGQLSAKGIIIINSRVGFDLQRTAPGTPPDPVIPTASIHAADIRAAGGIVCTGVTCSIRDMTFEYLPPDPVSPTPAILFNGATGGEAVGIIIVNSNPAGGIQPCTVDVIGSCWITLDQMKIIGPAGGIQPCVHVDPASRDIVIRDSVLSNCGGDGIKVEGINGILKGNLISGSANGIFAGGSNFIIDDGKLSGNAGAGIWFETSNHVYRGNILRGNTGGGTAGPGASDATDAGGNVQ